MRSSGILLFTLVLIFFTASCSKSDPDDIVKDPCKGVVCVNGNCIEGICECDFGWTGDDCSVTIVSKLKGFYEGILDCGITPDTMGLIVRDIDDKLNEVRMQTFNFKYSIAGIFSIDFDVYQMTARIDSSFVKFETDPVPGKISIPNFGDFNFELMAAGEFISDSELIVLISVKPENPLFPSFDCQGIMKK